jgi:hypothetical protein
VRRWCRETSPALRIELQTGARETNTTDTDLRLILSQLERFEQAEDSERRRIGAEIARAVTDTWNLSSPLSEQVLTFAQAARRPAS